MIHLKSIEFIKTEETAYPFNLPFFNQKIEFTSPITILIGDNGCGKSTLLQLIQNKMDLFQVGESFKKINHVKASVKYQLSKPRGYYFSSEDFTTYIKEIEKEKAYSYTQIEEVELEYKHRSNYAKSLAQSTHKKTIHELEALHDRDLSRSSHGEAYLSFFKSRIRPNQLILIDEPETPLSFENQLALLMILKNAIKDNAQLIIASHSPVIMAYPGAQILHFHQDGLVEMKYEDIEQVQNLKHFLNQPDAYFRHLF